MKRDSCIRTSCQNTRKSCLLLLIILRIYPLIEIACIRTSFRNIGKSCLLLVIILRISPLPDFDTCLLVCLLQNFLLYKEITCLRTSCELLRISCLLLVITLQIQPPDFDAFLLVCLVSCFRSKQASIKIRGYMCRMITRSKQDFCRSPVQSNLRLGRQGNQLEHPTPPHTNSPQLNNKEFKADQKTNFISLYQENPKQFFNLTPTQNSVKQGSKSPRWTIKLTLDKYKGI